MNYSPFRHLGAVFRNPAPIQLTVFLTRRCNARCSFCFYLSGEGGREPAGGEGELSLAELKLVSESAGRLLWLAFSGGEIFLRHDLVDIATAFYDRNRPAVILLPTNGLLPELIFQRTREILRRCPKSTIVVKISLDGPREVHDRLRGVTGAWEQALATYRRLSALVEQHHNFELGINTVFCAANQELMPAIIDQVGSLRHSRTHTVSLIRGEVGDPSLAEIDPDRYRDTIDLLAANLRKRNAVMYRFSGAGLKAAQDILQRRLIHQTLVRKRRLVPCHAGRLTLVVTERGEVYPCESFTRRIGNVRQAGYSLPALVRSEPMARARRTIAGQRCFCTHECYMMMNILFNPRLYPALLKEYGALCRPAAFSAAGIGGRGPAVAGRPLWSPGARKDS